MTGAELLVDALKHCGVDVWFANPGTTELDVLRAMEGRPDVACYIGLQENVCTGAADGYGRMTDKPAATLLHLGPGFANGIANLHNARRAGTPIVNVIGDHTSWHLPFDAPLASDIESLAAPVSRWLQRIESMNSLAPAATAAVAAAGQGGSATLIFPADFQYGEVAEACLSALPASSAPPPASVDVQAVAARLRQAKKPLFLLGGGGERSALSAAGQKLVAALCDKLNGVAYAETFPSRSERGQGLPTFDRLPYFPEPAKALLTASDVIVLVGTAKPITYFGYPGHASDMADAAKLVPLVAKGEDAVAALQELATHFATPVWQATKTEAPAPVTGALDAKKIAATLTINLPPDAIVSVEGGTCGYPFFAASGAAAPHTILTNTGGAIGQGLPVAMGAAIACPTRKVVALLSDGSTQYTVQTLWSIAHENLDVVTLIAANHQYAILRNELRRSNEPLGHRAERMTSLADPKICWVSLATGYGIKATSVSTAEALDTALKVAMAKKGPMLIEMQI